MADYIDRQTALEALYEVFFDDELRAAYPKEADKVLDVIRKAPSIQPERKNAYEEIFNIMFPPSQQEIIACGDCKYWVCHDRRCSYWNHGVKPLDWCSKAERRTDE